MPDVTARQVEKIARNALLTVQPSKMWRMLEFTALFTGIAALAFSAFAIHQTNQSLKASNLQTELAQEALIDARIATAYQILGSNSNDVGKSFAIQLLLQAGKSIENFDFSCEVPDGHWKGNIEAEDCLTHPTIRNANLSGDPKISAAGLGSPKTTAATGNKISDSFFQGVKFFNVNFKRIFIDYTNFEAAHFDQTQFIETDISNTDFDKISGRLSFSAAYKNPFESDASNSAGDDLPFEIIYFGKVSFNYTTAQIGFNNVSMSDSTFIGADISNMAFFNTQMENVNVSDAVLCKAFTKQPKKALCPTVNGTNFEGTFYFESNPPIGLEHFINLGVGIPQKCPPRPTISDIDTPKEFQYTWADYDIAAKAIGCPLYDDFGPKV